MKEILEEILGEVIDKLEKVNASLPKNEYNKEIEPLLELFITKLSGQFYNTFPHSVMFTFKNKLDAQGDSSEREEALNLFLFRATEKLTQEIVENSDRKTDKIRVLKILAKFEESIALMNQQKVMVRSVQSEHLQIFNNQSANFKKYVEELEEKVKKSEKNIEKSRIAQEQINKSQKDTQKEFVTILGIFTTIIFAAFGGLQLLTEIFKNMDQVSINKAVMHGSFVFLSLVLMLSLLFSGLSKMTGLTIRSCKCDNRQSCTCSLREKHPTVFYSFILVTVVVMFSIVDSYIGFKAPLKNVLSSTEGVTWLRLFNLIELSVFCILPALTIVLGDFALGKLVKK